MEIKNKTTKDLPKIVPPHNKISRIATEADIEKIIELSKDLQRICFDTTGTHKLAYAMHHSQIEETDPINFFVSADGEIIINPEITRHSNYTVNSKEGCYSYPELPPKEDVERWQKIEVKYITILENKFSSILEESLSGKAAFIFQHEFDHGEGKLIYD